jgi:nicotinate dehydrogenase subunit A
MSIPHEITVNGRTVTVSANPETLLLYLLRNDLQLNGPKFGCGLGECGACMVLAGDRAVRSCTVKIRDAAGRAFTTIEGLGVEERPHPVQQAFIEENAAQCGYCLNGMLIAATALLKRCPTPSEDEIRAALKHNLCRCGTHMEILAAVRKAAGLMREPAPIESAAG